MKLKAEYTIEVKGEEQKSSIINSLISQDYLVGVRSKEDIYFVDIYGKKDKEYPTPFISEQKTISPLIKEPETSGPPLGKSPWGITSTITDSPGVWDSPTFFTAPYPSSTITPEEQLLALEVLKKLNGL